MNSNWIYSPETPNLGQIRRFLEPCDLEIWRMTLKNNRAPLLSNIKLYASSHHHMWIQTGVTVRKRISWVVTSVTLTFDLWPWPFAWWTLRWSLVLQAVSVILAHNVIGVTIRSGLRYWLGYSHKTWIFRISRSFPAAISVIPRGTLRRWRNAQYPSLRE